MTAAVTSSNRVPDAGDGQSSPLRLEPDDVQAALAAWGEVLGDAYVESGEPTRHRYARSTSGRATLPLAVLRPEDVEQVRQVVGIAARFGIAVYPISKGKNWGYGDACAPTAGQVILDLGRMNRIIEVNDELAYAVIEPGVTQGQLYEYLQAHHPNLWLDSTGAGLDASLVGNTLDRGFGHTRYGDHFLSTCGMQVVLADGRVLDTGFGHFAQAQAHRVYRYGVGPFLDGLFAQSNYGIVTQIGLWLMQRPESFSGFFFQTEHEGDLAEIIDRLAPLRMAGVLTSTVHIGNDLRVFSSRAQFPWDRTVGRTPLPQEARREMRRAMRVGAWTVAGALYGTKQTVRAAKKAVKQAMRGYKVHFVDDRRLAMVEKWLRLVRPLGMGVRLNRQLAALKPVYGLLKGIPTDEPRRGVAWRVRDELGTTPHDPLDVHAGVKWASPVLANRGQSARDLIQLIEPIYEKHGFEAFITFTMITERAMIAVTNLAFDTRESDEVAAANACYDELIDAMIEHGYIPYRCGPGTYEKLAAHDSVFWDVAGQIKAALDPDQIISPGRYIPAPVPHTHD